VRTAENDPRIGPLPATEMWRSALTSRPLAAAKAMAASKDCSLACVATDVLHYLGKFLPEQEILP
jgi:hypothetical protein